MNSMSIKTLADLLSQSANRFPEATALVSQGIRYTYRELEEQTNRLAHDLIRRGVTPGERIGICCWNSPELVLALFAIWKVGGIVVDINPSFKPEEIIRIVRQCEIKMLITEKIQRNLWEQISSQFESLTILLTDEGEKGKIREGEKGRREELENRSRGGDSPSIACINYTSGTTGIPKGVLLPHKNLIRNAELNIKYFQISARDRTSLVLPLFFGMNKIFLLAHLMVGATVILERNFLSPNSVLASMEAEQVTGLSAVPTVYHTLLSRGDIRRYTLTSLRYFRIGAGQVTPQLIRNLREAFPRVDIYLTYGLTEVGLVTVLPPEKLQEKAGSCGRIIPEVQVHLAKGEEGSEKEIVIRCDHSAIGYYKNEEATRQVFKEDGIHTGDLGWMDEEGYLYLAGRQKDLIKSGSENIHPSEIEAVLIGHEGVADCAVVGVPDEWLGEAIQAYIVPKEGFYLDSDQILRFCVGRLSPIKRPKYIIICDKLPRTETGKIKKRELREIG
ncbi:MAG TPA: class I adenylate-forming enzyme family protein [Candidatus Limnocylindrales bacterium]|nr:class I adenylate-forming enzyme family protein [Candidatus Limnocylindrales bacterium]